MLNKLNNPLRQDKQEILANRSLLNQVVDAVNGQIGAYAHLNVDASSSLIALAATVLDLDDADWHTSLSNFTLDSGNNTLVAGTGAGGLYVVIFTGRTGLTADLIIQVNGSNVSAGSAIGGGGATTIWLGTLEDGDTLTFLETSGQAVLIDPSITVIKLKE